MPTKPGKAKTRGEVYSKRMETKFKNFCERIDQSLVRPTESAPLLAEFKMLKIFPPNERSDTSDHRAVSPVSNVSVWVCLAARPFASAAVCRGRKDETVLKVVAPCAHSVEGRLGLSSW